MDFMKTIISAIKHWANNRFTVDSTLSTVAKTGRYEDMEGLIDETSIPNSIARIEAGQYSVTATSTNGWLYIATVPHIKELTTGVSFIMIPEITSTSKNPVLNINNFGQIGIKRNLSWSNANYYEGPFTSWLYAGRPVRLIYNGTCWIAESLSKPDVRDIEGTLSIDHGGTGGTTVENARNNLKVYSKTEVDTLIEDLDVSEQIANAMSDLATVATTGSYNDLIDKPSEIKTFVDLLDSTQNIVYRIAMRDGNLVIYLPISSISVTTPPNKTEYMAGEPFDTTGIVLTATMTDGVSQKEVYGCIAPNPYLSYGQTSIELQYTDEDGKIYITSTPVTVTPFDPTEKLVDFAYTANDDGTYTLTGWKQTLNGITNTEMIIPDNSLIVL